MVKKSSLPVAKLQTVSVAPAMPRRSAEDIARDRRYRAEDALRDIERAEGHKSNKDLMKDVKSLAREKMKNLGKLC